MGETRGTVHHGANSSAAVNLNETRYRLLKGGTAMGQSFSFKEQKWGRRKGWRVPRRSKTWSRQIPWVLRLENNPKSMHLGLGLGVCNFILSSQGHCPSKCGLGTAACRRCRVSYHTFNLLNKSLYLNKTAVFHVHIKVWQALSVLMFLM